MKAKINIYHSKHFFFLILPVALPVTTTSIYCFACDSQKASPVVPGQLIQKILAPPLSQNIPWFRDSWLRVLLGPPPLPLPPSLLVAGYGSGFPRMYD